MNHWLFKTEPDTYSIDDLRREGRCGWEGIRNYQARNRLRDEVQDGDQVLIYHSSCPVPAIVGLACVVGTARPDPTQFNPESPYYDPKSSLDNPRWVLVDIQWQETFAKPLPLKQVKTETRFREMELVSRGRLSIQEVDDQSFRHIVARCR
ncbi:MAG: EVE domain-containing protein [Gammaproteobacteria bacterium HGW-Gammaproteobacteria-14]|nr:MAG: EVE domain-containing protein [Gammaproteobacteria bacterium HGW-Gammaproteobacteria-14]